MYMVGWKTLARPEKCIMTTSLDRLIGIVTPWYRTQNSSTYTSMKQKCKGFPAGPLA